MTDLRVGLVKRVASAYLLYGNEPGLLHDGLAAIREAVLEPDTAAFNHEKFNGAELDGVGRVLDACEQVPMLAQRRLIELSGPELIAKGDEGKANIDALVRYLANPCETTVLVISSSGIDGRSKLVTATKKVGVVHRLEPIKKARDAVSFVIARATELPAKLSTSAATRLVELVGTQPSALLAALDRAFLHAGQAKISVDDVEAVAGNAREAVVFELTDAIGLGQRDVALAVLSRLYRESSNEIGTTNAVLAMLIRQLRLIFVAQAVGGDASRIGQRAGVPPFVANKLARQARQMPVARLRRAFTGLEQLDRDLKGGSFVVVRAPAMALQRWILETCGDLPGVARRRA